MIIIGLCSHQIWLGGLSDNRETLLEMGAW